VDVLLEEQGKAIIEFPEQPIVAIVSECKGESEVRRDGVRRKAVSEQDEGLADCIADPCLDVNVRFALRFPGVKDAKIRRPNPAYDIIQDLHASDIAPRPIEFDIIRLQDLPEVPS
jgi:hypothetical protein